MGNVASRVRESSREREQAYLARFVRRLTQGPDLTVNKSIGMFTSLSSSEYLNQHFQRSKMEAGDCAADWIKKLVEKLANFTPVPQLAGLGALAISVIIDVVSFVPPEETVKNTLQSVFAEEKTSEIWDQIDECLKRCVMHIDNDDELKSDLERIECQLSAALTKLKNFMMRDGHKSSQALKAWVNGAAFHIQMLIHLLILKRSHNLHNLHTQLHNLLLMYPIDLDLLFEKHKQMVKGKCTVRKIRPVFKIVPDGLIWMVDEDLKWYSIDMLISYEKYFEAYYNHRYGQQKDNIKTYFSDVKVDLNKLVVQIKSFNVS
ncbi:uncharacterized protein LOC127374591 [Dicentrarchus labrax]|uniref:uncharacterized protein LOC127374591 n=1 Tax=Dicentrarchus labrax TaxID=13489 RepID=UPI0021F5F3C8|nr:uncharacterized protein LOC127374591 [Dicentrarchus labrax]XP_051276097.1 uncharacterized protein LOC127374591 [Dicentrarchus labrax]